MAEKRRYRVIVDVKPRPRAFEVTAAELVADFLKADVIFLQEGRTKTPDLLIRGQEWEIKRPTGSTESGVVRQFQRAGKQAQNMVFDGRGSGLHPEKLRNLVVRSFYDSRKIKRLLFINKAGKVEEIKKKKCR